MDACSRALLQAGAKSVVGLTVGRAVEAWTEFNLGGEVGLVRSRQASEGLGNSRTRRADGTKDASKGW